MKYGDIRLPDEEQFSVYNFEKADVDKLWQHLELYEAECQALVNEYARSRQARPKKQDQERVRQLRRRATAKAKSVPRAPAFSVAAGLSISA